MEEKEQETEGDLKIKRRIEEKERKIEANQEEKETPCIAIMENEGETIQIRVKLPGKHLLFYCRGGFYLLQRE